MSTTPPKILSNRAVWWLNAIAIALFWAIYLWIQVPVPGVNEPHYLCKAKHFWDPSYCHGDFFLDSSNTHFVFYSTFGVLTKWMSLATVAMIGRAVGVLLLATGWTAVASRLSPIRWAPFGSAAMFLGLTSWQNFSGEWIVGGLESKVIAYGCLFFSWRLMFDRRWKIAAVMLGTAISFHPVVAGWGLISTLIAFACLKWRGKLDSQILSLKDFISSAGLTLVCGLPGLVPALATILTPVENATKADHLQVFRRLGHHLNPVQFSLRAYVVYGLLLALWMVIVILRARLSNRKETAESSIDFPQTLWRMIVAGSLLVAISGLGIGWLNHFTEPSKLQDLLVKLMKFYPFRLADTLLPMAASIAVFDLCRRRDTIVLWRRVLIAGLSLGGFATALWLVMPSRNVDGYSASKTKSWVEICFWIDDHLAEDVLVLAPRSSVTFRWHASRAAYVTFKDCPQDAAGILEWDRRLNLYQDWASRAYENDRLFDDRELEELVGLTGATHLLVSRMGPFERDPIQRNKHYRIYELPKISKE